MWNDIGQGQFGNKPSYLNWEKEEPNDKHYDRLTPQRCDGEDCVKINIWNGVVTWFDLSCDITLPFICEKSRGEKASLLSVFVMGLCLFVCSFDVLFVCFRLEAGNIHKMRRGWIV